MKRFAIFVAALAAAASSTLWPVAASAHGGAHDVAAGHHAWGASPSGAEGAEGDGAARDANDSRLVRLPVAASGGDALVQAIEPSHCPADDDGLPCACGPDRCTNSPQPLPLLAQTRTVDQLPPRFDVRPRTSDADAVAACSPAGSIGARAPPHSS